MMKKYCLVGFMLVAIATNAYAGWHKGASGRCVVDTDGSGQKFYYCGDQDKNCAGYIEGGRDNGYWLSNGQRIADTDNYCCDNYIKTIDNPDSFYYGLTYTDENGVTHTYAADSSDDIKAKAKIQLHTLPDNAGTCTYEKKFDNCGHDISVLCTVPTACVAGRLMRGGKCVDPCPAGQAFETDNSGTCVPCPSSLIGGRHPTTNTCIQCHETGQIFSYKDGKCVDKSDMVKFAPGDMRKCWQCENNDAFKKCMATTDGNYSKDIEERCFKIKK